MSLRVGRNHLSRGRGLTLLAFPSMDLTWIPEYGITRHFRASWAYPEDPGAWPSTDPRPCQAPRDSGLEDRRSALTLKDIDSSIGKAEALNNWNRRPVHQARSGRRRRDIWRSRFPLLFWRQIPPTRHITPVECNRRRAVDPARDPPPRGLDPARLRSDSQGKSKFLDVAHESTKALLGAWPSRAEDRVLNDRSVTWPWPAPSLLCAQLAPLARRAARLPVPEPRASRAPLRHPSRRGGRREWRPCAVRTTRAEHRRRS